MTPEGWDEEKLAAAAPEMARVLLEYEWTDRDFNGARCCIACGQYMPKHHDGCAWDGALRKAGIRPTVTG
ncbi:hypothetical protein AKJ09_09874 [Labilithrix luteola]|uniref:Uncharacterized protein n=2 Tax=Labilithrix luteola TaxID=1391654 RepID=A0A0K1QBS3_9BACT|nr:hypothetical protein AKJ09_09874 [Labilithrix luteola]